jgi:hypothetical protein
MGGGIHSNRRLLLRFIPLALGIACGGGVRAETSDVCTSLAVHASIQRGAGHTLVISVENPTSKPVEMEEFYFGASLLRLNAIERSGGRALKEVIPLLSPGVATVKIEPGAKAVREIQLDVVFPDLRATLKRSDVDIAWEFTVKPNEGCFSGQVATTMRLRKD